jgi:hypothetical protein
MGICYGMQEGVREDIKKIAIDALHESLPFSRNQLEKQVDLVYFLMIRK